MEYQLPKVRMEYQLPSPRAALKPGLPLERMPHETVSANSPARWHMRRSKLSIFQNNRHLFSIFFPIRMRGLDCIVVTYLSQMFTPIVLF